MMKCPHANLQTLCTTSGSNSQRTCACLYEVVLDDLVRSFMQIKNFRSWLKGYFLGKGLHSIFLELKVVAECRDLKLLEEVMKYFPRVKGMNTKDCALKGLELFGSTKRKLDLASSFYCNSH